MAQPWILSIDFGTSYTLVAAKLGDRSPEVVEIGGERRMPSVIMVESSGAVVVGRTADDLSGSNPANTLRAPKNRLGDQAPVVLGGRPYQVVQLVAGLLRTVYDEAVAQIGEPPTEVRLTHPATWNRPRLNRLLEAAAKAGLPNPALVPEPVAAALSYASESGVPEGGHLVVYDLGGGTFDTAVVTARRGGFVVEGRPGGDQNIGGELFDELVMNHVGERLDPEAWEQIQIGDDPTWQQVGASLRKEARRAKETLSSHPYADLLLPLPDGLVQQRITRDEFEQIVGPYIDETVNLLRRCITDAGVDDASVSSIYLVGGASRSPIVERLVRAAFPTVAVSRRGDPKTSVALGAARAVRSAGSTALGGQRSTQEASPSTADEPLLLGPPSGPNAPTSQPSQPSQPSVPPPSSHPSSPPAPVGGSPSAPPSVGPPASSPPTATGGPGTLSGGSRPPTPSYLAGGSPPARPSGPPTASPAKGPWNPKTLGIIAAAAVVLGAIIGVIVLKATDSGASPETTERTRRTTTEPDETTTTTTTTVGAPADPEGVLITLDEATAGFDGTTWTEIEGLDPDFVGSTFCDFTSLSTPTMSVLRGYHSDTDLDLYSRIDEFADDEAALRSLGQDQSLAANCTGEHPYDINGIEYTATIFDATADLGELLGADSAAVGYVLVPPAEETDLTQITGYILEWRKGKYIVSAELSADGRTPNDDENNDFGAIVATYFLRSDVLA